jgi:hypothetical protein
LKQEDGTGWGCLNMKEFVISFETELEIDEFHYLFICEKQEIKTIREKFIPIYYTKYPSELKLSRMLMYCHVELYRNLASFLKIMVRFL